MAWEIIATRLSSALFNGTAENDFFEGIIEGFTAKKIDLGKLGDKFNSFIKGAIDKVKDGWNFFKQWMADDPFGASAGAGAVLLTGGVLLIVGGTAVGAIASGGTVAAGAAGTAGAGGLFATVIGWAKTAAVSALSAVTLGTLIRFVVRGTQYLWSFNWNITDKQLTQQQDSLITTLYGQAGTALGSTFGTLLCGSAPVELSKRTKLVKTNPLALAKIKEMSEFDPMSDNYGELYEEMMENVKALVNAGGRIASQYLFIESFKNVRKWIKLGSKAAGLANLFPGLAGLIEKWGEEGSQSWSFASATEEWIENIDDKKMQNFTEEFIESFMESCTESLMVISYAF